MMHELKTCKCKWCNIDTTNIEDQQCDGCWELYHRIEWAPERAREMLRSIENQ